MTRGSNDEKMVAADGPRSWGVALVENFEAALAWLLNAIRTLALLVAPKLRFRVEPEELASQVMTKYAIKLRRAHDKGDHTEFLEMCQASDLSRWVVPAVRSRGHDQWREDQAALRHGMVYRELRALEGNTFAHPDVIVDSDELWRIAEKTLASMSQQHRDVFKLKYVLGLHWSEVAERTGMSEHTARRRYYAVLARLRKRLARFRGWNPESELGIEEGIQS